MIVHLVTGQLTNRSRCERCGKSANTMQHGKESITQDQEAYDEGLPDGCYSCDDVSYMLEGFKDPYED